MSLRLRGLGDHPLFNLTLNQLSYLIPIVIKQCEKKWYLDRVYTGHGKPRKVIESHGILDA